MAPFRVILKTSEGPHYLSPPVRLVTKIQFGFAIAMKRNNKHCNIWKYWQTINLEMETIPSKFQVYKDVILI